MEELTRRNQDLLIALDAKDRECAELSAALETGGDRLAAGVRESKIVEMAKKNRALTLAVEKERAEKVRLATEMKAARAGMGTGSGLSGGIGNESNDSSGRSESQIEKACREVVAEAAKAAETASKQCAEWRDKAKDASSRAERDVGRYNTVKAENDRLKAIIKKEVGDANVDFAKLDESLENAGGWRGRAREIQQLRHKVKSLKARLEAYEDGVVSNTDDRSEFPENLDSRPSTAATDMTRVTSRSNFTITHETAREATARRKQLEDATNKLALSNAECEEAKTKAKAITARKDALERDVRGLREKLEVLMQKSQNDDRLIDALRLETKKVKDRERDFHESGTVGMSMGSIGGKNTNFTGTSTNFNGTSVPAAVYKTMERQVETQDLKLRETEQHVLQLRAKIASMENENDAAQHSVKDRDARNFASTTREIAAAAADIPLDMPEVSQQHQDDIAALIEHAETLERTTHALKGKLAISTKTEEALRAQLGEAHHATHALKVQLKSSSGRYEGGGGQQVGYGDIHGSDDVASLRARLRSTEAELEKVQRSSRKQLDSMEKEVELYYEMTEELKRQTRGGM